MSAFTHAVGFSVILGQLSNLTGYAAQGPNKPMQTIDLLLHLDQVNVDALIVRFPASPLLKNENVSS